MGTNFDLELIQIQLRIIPLNDLISSLIVNMSKMILWHKQQNIWNFFCLDIKLGKVILLSVRNVGVHTYHLELPLQLDRINMTEISLGMK